MGLTKAEKKQYLNIADGRIRMLTTKDDPEAEERYVESTGKFKYEKVFKDCTGFLRDIKISEHETYGVSYSLDLYDPDIDDTFSLQISENSRYYQSFIQHLPNIDFSKPLTVKPYKVKGEEYNNIGLVFHQNGVKVENYYRKVTDKTTDPPITKPCNGLEKFNFKGLGKRDKDIEKANLMKFFEKEMKAQIIRLAEYVESNPIKRKAAEDTEEPQDTTPRKKKAAEKEPEEKLKRKSRKLPY